MLADWAVRGGVESTTRYRKQHPARRCGPPVHHGSIPTRASGRKSGVNKSRTAGQKQSMLSPSANPDMLARHIDPFHASMYNRPLSYDYAPAPLGAHPTSNAPDWMSRPLHPAPLPPAANYEFSGYTYSNPPQGQTMGGLPQREHSQALYPTADMMGVYGGPHLPANPRVHSDQMAPSPRYDMFPNPQETVDGPNYFAWNQTNGGGACT